jgi:hypothetical protein
MMLAAPKAHTVLLAVLAAVAVASITVVVCPILDYTLAPAMLTRVTASDNAEASLQKVKTI